MTSISAEMTVGEIVAEKPGRSRVFEKLHIDYCCGGKKTLAETCAKKNLSAPDIIEELLKADDAESKDEHLDVNLISLNALIDHILERHHAFLLQELPRLHAMIEKVTRVHGDKDARFAEILKIYGAMRDELESHMQKEERILFPAIRLIETSPEVPIFPFPTIAFPMQVMENEHDTVGDALEKISALSDSYSPPDWACNTYRAMLSGLQELEVDLHQHIHKENNILFPKALTLEAKRAQED